MKIKMAIIMVGVILVGAIIGSSYLALAGTLFKPEPGGMGEPLPGQQLPQLTDAEKAKAVEIALSDSRLQELIAGKSYEVAFVGISTFTTPDRQVMRIGAIVGIEFDKPYWIEYDYPDREYKYDETLSTYEEITVHRSDMVSALGISVDLRDDKVARITAIPKRPPEQ